MQQCSSCNQPLPDGEDLLYCPKCRTQVRCSRDKCKALLELDAICCVACGTPVGKGEVTTNGKAAVASHNINHTIPLNTLDFVKTGKNETISLKATFTTEFGVAGTSTFAAMANGHGVLEKLKNGRAQVQGISSTEVQQLSLLGEEAQQTIDVEAHEEPINPKNVVKEPTNSKKPSSSNSRPKRTRKSATPEILELDLESGELPFKTFCQQKSPNQDSKKYLVIAAWFHDYQNQKEISTAHIYTCYRFMGWGAPPDMGKPFRNMQEQGWFKNVGKNVWAINHVGLNVVNKMKEN